MGKPELDLAVEMVVRWDLNDPCIHVSFGLQAVDVDGDHARTHATRIDDSGRRPEASIDHELSDADDGDSRCQLFGTVTHGRLLEVSAGTGHEG